MSPRRADDEAAGPDEPDRPRAGLLFDELAAQLDRFRLLPGGSDARAEQVLAGLTPGSAREQEALKELADRQILAHPNHFEAAPHLVVKALEVFDRHGWRAPGLPRRLGRCGPSRASASSRSRTSSCARTRAPWPTRCGASTSAVRPNATSISPSAG